MLDLDGDLFALTKARQYYPLPDAPSVCTFHRWAFKGVGKDRIKLETVKIGGRRYTSRAALERFVERLTGAGEKREELTRRRTDAYRRADQQCAKDKF